MDIFKNSIEDSTADDIVISLELDRLKAKIMQVWNEGLIQQYEQEKSQSNTEVPLPEINEYLAMYAIKFPNDEEEISDEDELVKILEEMTNPDEHLEPVNKDLKKSNIKTSSLSLGNVLEKDIKRLKNLIKRNNKKYGVVL